jgi:triacylglycerol esterase/lipase EstA (alpha/beta hydrolase family)
MFCGAAHAQSDGVPIILVKGYGPKSAQLVYYQRFLREDGFDPKHTHVLQYEQTQTPAVLQTGAQASLAKIVAKYPPETRFDMITHSFGGFVGLYAAMPTELAGRIRKYITLAGVTRGQDWLPFCHRGWCGGTLSKLIPFENPFVTDFMDTYSAQIAALEKCSLYSWDDTIVHEPADAGTLPGGTNVEVRGVRHMGFVLERDLYRIMRTACYGAPAPQGGFRHDWRVR